MLSGAFPFLGKHQREFNVTLKSLKVHENDVTKYVGKKKIKKAKDKQKFSSNEFLKFNKLLSKKEGYGYFAAKL